MLFTLDFALNYGKTHKHSQHNKAMIYVSGIRSPKWCHQTVAYTQAMQLWCVPTTSCSPLYILFCYGIHSKKDDLGLFWIIVSCLLIIGDRFICGIVHTIRLTDIIYIFICCCRGYKVADFVLWWVIISRCTVVWILIFIRQRRGSINMLVKIWNRKSTLSAFITFCS